VPFTLTSGKKPEPLRLRNNKVFVLVAAYKSRPFDYKPDSSEHVVQRSKANGRTTLAKNHSPFISKLKENRDVI